MQSFENVKDFLDAISSLNEENPWHNSPNNWIFRGQGQLRPMCPKVIREEELEKYYFPQPPSNWQFSKNGEQNYKEIYILKTFFETLDRHGISTPIDCSDIRKKIRNLNEKIIENRGEDIGETISRSHPLSIINYWPPSERDNQWFSLMSFAQHYGVATRLLDWTRRSYIAAYFAAREAVKEPSGDLVVWASKISDLERSEKIKVIALPGIGNLNLSAQMGVMTVNTYSSDISEIRNGIERIVEIKDLLECYTLPVSEAGKLLRLLSLENIDGAAMHPGIEGVVRKVHEVKYWDRPFEGNVKTY